ncbi:hydrogenase maturation protease [Halalkaliarchaeum desulfuricum]|uniref:Hydrogenase maturation protease n=1 Tax=Halalkaliarchaeum desulfuricum TaxID=2055893 RepID=A0A343TLS2_9EURY|nr:hydrogenase maturation protease [Halalkaliarchaeum desulfuricum]AUX10044.1 hydrogenase maturation protease [Halalkaliarchaeum desulfuricum]
MIGFDAVIGLGNPFRRDDGVGPELIERLQNRNLPNTDVIDIGDHPFQLIHVVKDYEAVLIVDAVDFGGKPGSFKVFDPAKTDTNQQLRSSHKTDVFELLEVSDTIGEPTKVRIFGIQPKSFELSEEFSPEIQETIPELTEELLDTVRSRGCVTT